MHLLLLLGCELYLRSYLNDQGIGTVNAQSVGDADKNRRCRILNYKRPREYVPGMERWTIIDRHVGDLAGAVNPYCPTGFWPRCSKLRPRSLWGRVMWRGNCAGDA